MARYIDADKLIDKLEELQFNAPTMTPVMKIYNVIELVEDQPTADVEEVPKWIDVKERLPKDNEKVLCLCQADIYEVLTWDNVQRHWVHDSNHIYFKTFVRYWQTLPEPPTKSEAKKNDS